MWPLRTSVITMALRQSAGRSTVVFRTFWDKGQARESNRLSFRAQAPAEAVDVHEHQKTLLAARLACADPGDEVLVPAPWFRVLPGRYPARWCGAPPGAANPRRLAARRRRRPSRDYLAPRAILLNTRHNPTGCVFSASEITALVEVCVQRDLVCVTNEVYDSFVFGRCEMTSPLDLSAAREHLIAVGSFFKSPQMSVWRLGHCVAPPTLTAGLRRVVERTTVCAATPLQEGDAAVSTASSGAEHFRVTWKPMIERLAGPVWRRSPQRAAGSDSRGSTGPLRCPPTNPPPGRSTRRGPWWHRAPPSSITSS
ncbi:aminotransferase class I/II-fold pyridoxal phosphate-dependent enzyme [Streptomyces sp. DASNCL29]|nr:aminotransferase class I/II-fold pyridoxal phosphate-dependent enzyme [Streptomyces sp. DASNCL29]